jgi:hypothetical protein
MAFSLGFEKEIGMKNACSWAMGTLPLSIVALFGLAGTARADFVYKFDVSPRQHH